MLWTVLRSNEPNEPQTNTNELLYKAPGLLFTNVHKKEAFDHLRALTLLFIRRRFSCSRFLRWPWRSVSLTTSRTAIDYQCPFPWHWLMVLSGLRQTEFGVWCGVITRDDFGPGRGGTRHPFPTTILLLSLPPPIPSPAGKVNSAADAARHADVTFVTWRENALQKSTIDPLHSSTPQLDPSSNTTLCRGAI